MFIKPSQRAKGKAVNTVFVESIEFEQYQDKALIFFHMNSGNTVVWHYNELDSYYTDLHKVEATLKITSIGEY